MPGFGPAPSETRRRRNQDSFAADTVTVTAETTDVPDLPNRDNYRVETQEWYDTWATSPQGALFLPTDWQRLHMIAPLVERYFAEPSEKRFAEIRQNESLLGATHIDRLRGRIKVSKPVAQDKPGTVTSIADRRSRLIADGS